MGAFCSSNQPDDKQRTRTAAPLPSWLARALPRLVLLAATCVSFATARAWVTACTHRLYLDERADVGSSSEARQRFVVEDARVVPQILSQGTDAFRFRGPDSRGGRLRFRVRPEGPAAIEVRWSDGQRSEVLVRQAVTEPLELTRRLPADGGVLDLASQGTVTWSDLRVEDSLPLWPHVVMLVLLAVLALALPRAHPRLSVDWTARERGLIVRATAAALTIAIVATALEATLRVAARLSPSLMAVDRSRLGEVAPDPHWQDSPRFGRIPRPNRDATGEWAQGDIVRMGFVSPELSPGLRHRFPVRTDREGFRNDGEGARVDVAALGDSFTDALTLPVELGWPARLAARTGREVRNYGVAGFGPQQELRVLRDFVLPRRPRVVVLAFFSGNDIPGAALFEEFERGGGAGSFGVSGWPFKRVVARFDRSYAYLLTRRLLVRDAQADASPAGRPGERFDAAFTGEDPAAPEVTRASFDRGLFAVPVGGRSLRFALMPPYLNLLNLEAADLKRHRGWQLARDAILEMDGACRGAGARFVVMFIPSKCQVYLPVLQRAFPPQELRRALAFSLPRDPWAVDLHRLQRNRLVQNELLRDFCRREGIPLLDLTPALETIVAGGRNLYFPDDSHWNARGHEVAAAELARFLEPEPTPKLHAALR
jgi:lysophospholipase L1-like esterase